MNKPSLAEVIALANEAALLGVRVALPATITKFDKSTHRAEVQILLQERHEGPNGTEAVTVPVLSDVPVQFPGFGRNKITFPVNKGDGVLLVFTSSAIARWKAGAKGAHDPGDDRHHALPDAIAIAGCDAEPTVDSSQSYVEIHSDSTIRCGGDQPLVTREEFNNHFHGGVSSGSSATAVPTPINGTTKLRG